MRVVRSFPHPVRSIEHLWIPMSDGCRLAARAWMPAGAEARPVAAIIEYLPYRKRTGTRWRDEPMHAWFAGHGYASLRIDVRGTGESDGLLLDEYLPQEQHDAVEAIEWIARQPWCSGAVGMMGISWGGFNALQVAALAPPSLRAIITLCASDDRYTDDAHYMGGCLLAENVAWGSLLQVIASLPPDPALVGAGWRDAWRRRVEQSPLYIERWLRHQQRDGYWRQGSVCERYAAIQCPVWIVGGWADGYTNAVPRLMEHLTVPRRALIGPWAHRYPHEGAPGPAIGFLQEALRWWDRWLRGAASGVMDEPCYRVWMPHGASCEGEGGGGGGRWVAESTWPSPRIAPRRWFIHERALIDERPPAAHPAAPRILEPDQTVGFTAGAWCSFGHPGDEPGEQHDDDRRSLCFDTAPLPAPMEILGAPLIQLHLAIDRPAGLVAARIADVDPAGRSRRVTYGVLNLAHRGGHEAPRPMVPGRRERIELRLNHAAHRFETGHRVRLAISTAYWPIVWPSPEPVTLTLLGAGELELPLRPLEDDEARLPPFDEPAIAPPLDATDISRGRFERRAQRDPESGATMHEAVSDVDEHGEPALARIHAIDLEVGHGTVQRCEIRPEDPCSARAVAAHHAIEQRRGWRVSVQGHMQLTATATAFELEAELVAREAETAIATRSWRCRVPRGLI